MLLSHRKGVIMTVLSLFMYLAASSVHAFQMQLLRSGQVSLRKPAQLMGRGIQIRSAHNLRPDVAVPHLSLSSSHLPTQMANAVYLAPNFPRYVTRTIMESTGMKDLVTLAPREVKELVKFLNPWELLVLLVFRCSYSGILTSTHKLQTTLWKLTKREKPHEWNSSILGFVHQRSGMLAKLITFNYFSKLVCAVLVRLGFNIHPEFPSLVSRISYALFMAQFADMFKSRFLRSFFPKVGDSKRQSYMVDKSASVVIWTVGGLVACEMLSSFLKVPLSSTLAFGGVGGLAMGLSLRDIAANFMGGLMLLVNEPFTPGDMVTFQNEKMEFTGRVERVGWGQTRIRGRDTWPTYVPNAHFAQAAVTNMERITHRKFEAVIPLRFQDHKVLPAVIERIRERLRELPKLDMLSMPFRVSFAKVGAYSLDIEIVCYFATKSIDEFLSLQQTANMEVIGAIHACGAELALPTSLMRMDSLGLAPDQVGPGSAAASGSGADSSAYSTIMVGGECVTPSNANSLSGDHVNHNPGSAAWTTQSDLADEMELAETLSDY